jgi:predicted methyltransferase
MSARRTQQAHTLVADVISAGDIAVDATAGNGHDTIFLARCVGPRGRVFSFDVQRQALAATEAAVNTLDPVLACRVELILDDHAILAARLPPAMRGRVAAIMFNLGYLPGGDKQVTTRVESTLAAVHAGAQLLRPGGLITVVGYVGHASGRQEVDVLEEMLQDGSSPLAWREHDAHGAPSNAPRLFAGIKSQG